MFSIKKYSSSGVYKGSILGLYDTKHEARVKLKTVKIKALNQGLEASELENDGLEITSDYMADAFQYYITKEVAK